MVTAHFTTSPELRVSNGHKHQLLYDYYNFPPESYKLRYDAPGDPEVAGWVIEALRGAGMKVVEDTERGKAARTLPTGDRGKKGGRWADQVGQAGTTASSCP